MRLTESCLVAGIVVGLGLSAPALAQDSSGAKPALHAGSLVTEAMMLDLLMVALTIVFFVIAVTYVVVCERLE